MKCTITLSLIVLGVFVFAGPGSAQQYPNRTVTIIVPYPPGGPTDETARVVAQSLAEKFKQSVIVENVTGGATIIATNRVARAVPDGYTLLLHNLQISANAALYKTLPFDTAKDLTPVILINQNPLVLVGRKTLEPNTLKALVEAMKSQRMKVAIPGYGATGHLTTTLFGQEAKVQLDQIPYRGAAPAITELLGGHVDLFFSTPQAILQQVSAGQLKAYGITSREKMADLPTAESLVEAFGPKLEVVFWQAMFAPAGTPDSVVKVLNAVLQDVVTDPKIVKNWAVEGVTTFPKDQLSPGAASAMLKSEMARWGQVIRDNDIHVQQ